MIFMYWMNEAIPNAPAAEAWGALYSNFRVCNDDDVLPLIPEDFVSSYRAIRLQAAKSDLARLLLLRAYGGLYVDAHFGPTEPRHLFATVEALSAYNLILFGKGWVMTEEHDFDLVNGAMAARKGAPELDTLINKIMHNLRDQQDKERAIGGYSPYNLHFLTGTQILIDLFFDRVLPRPQIKPHLKGKVQAHFMRDNKSSGFEIAAYYTYREPGNHWSERQSTERLFQS